MKLKLVKKVEEAPLTYSFYFEPSEKIDFAAGQYIYIDLPKLNYEDPRGATRQFTIASSPTEAEIRITTRIRQESGYKKTLYELKIGESISARGPFGYFILPNSLSPKTYNLFLAGGIGITPFRSMIKYNIDSKLSIPMFLIYSNSDSNFVFKDELDKWQLENDFLKIHYHNSSISGHLDKNLLDSLLSTYYMLPTTYYVVGPPLFVNSMEQILEDLKIPNNNIRTEKFTGY